MTKAQREAVDARMRTPQPSKPPTVQEMRAGFAALMGTMNVANGIRTATTTLGDRSALLVEPGGPAEPGTILYFHGGGNVFGSPETAMSLTSALVARSHIRSFSIDYRLAPENPFPAGADDALAAYRALLDGGSVPESIVFAGDSAGGGLAITTPLMARDAGLPMPAAVVAMSPGLDYTRSGASIETRAGFDPFFTREGLMVTAKMYLADQDPDQELSSPAIRANLKGLTPLLLQTGTNELLLDDSTRMALRARDAGVDVILDITADVPHVFQAFTGTLDEADEALDRAVLFITQHIGK
jgi:acetyl esterase/lipase